MHTDSLSGRLALVVLLVAVAFGLGFAARHLGSIPASTELNIHPGLIYPAVSPPVLPSVHRR